MSTRNYHYTLYNILEEHILIYFAAEASNNATLLFLHSCNIRSPSRYYSLSRPNKMCWGEQVMGIAIKLQKL